MPSQTEQTNALEADAARDGLSGVRRALNWGASGVLIVLMTIGASLMLWIGVPVAWLRLGSQIEGWTHDVGVAIGATLVGAVVSVVALVWVLGRLNRAEERLRVARGSIDSGPPLIEFVVVVTAAVAVLAFAIWFFLLAAPGPRAVPDI